MNYEWTIAEMSLLLRAERNILYEDEETTLQETLTNSFDISHSDFTKEMVIANLKKSFKVEINLCNECSMARHQDKLDQNQGLYNECALIEETPEESEEEKFEEPIKLDPLQPTEQEQRIQQLEDRVWKLEQYNRQLVQMIIHDS